MVESLNHLLESFARLRRSKVFRQSIEGGVGCAETKRGSGSGEWHVHIHTLCTTDYIDWSKLRDAWRTATKDSHIIQAEHPKDTNRVGFYVTKYVGKGFDRSVLRSHSDLCECICGLSGRRLLIPFGTWYGRDDDPDDRDPDEWSKVGSLDSVAAEAAAGSEVHAGYLTSLRSFNEKNAAAWSRDPTE